MTDLGVPEFIVRDVLRGELAKNLVGVPCGVCDGAACGRCGGTGTGGTRPEVELLGARPLNLRGSIGPA